MSTPPAPGTFTPPAYGDRSLADVVPSVARALGAELDGHPAGLELPPAPSYVVFLVDGMGAELLTRYGHSAPYLSSLVEGSATGTAGVPSTTATSLTSLGTGLVPGAHGLVGFTARIPGTDRLLNHLWWDKGVDPLQWQPHPIVSTASAGGATPAVGLATIRVTTTVRMAVSVTASVVVEV